LRKNIEKYVATMGCDYPKYTRKTKFCEGYLRIVAVRRCREAIWVDALQEPNLIYLVIFPV